MSFVKIVAPLSGGPGDEAVLASAVAAAIPFGAHVMGLFARPDPTLSMPFYGEGVSTFVLQEAIDASNEASERAARAARAMLGRLARATDIVVTPGCEKRDAPTLSFRETPGNFADCIERAARLCDLVVLAAPKDDEPAGVGEAIETVLLEARRPVLLCARALTPGFAQKIAIGWNASVACARAVTAALPFLVRAKSVEVLSVEAKDTPCAECGEAVEYLSLHGVGAATRTIEAGIRPVADVLLESAAASGAGLLVLGGHGHSRWRELFVDGVTRHAIAHADLPLFLMH